ncbi:hypothetical protein BDZ97DRAFT_275701 [Flammula alnicola]|nr:hypothetical protein BDZ97DRAFT_275701 [Flammula alnicola]
MRWFITLNEIHRNFLQTFSHVFPFLLTPQKNPLDDQRVYCATMPPKTRKSGNAKSAPKKAATAPKPTAVKNANSDASTTNSNSVATNKRRAESPPLEDAPQKKAKVVAPAVQEVSNGSEDDDEAVEEMDVEEIQWEIRDIRDTLEDHTPRSMAAVMDAIAFQGSRPDTVPEMIDAVGQELIDRFLDGQDIMKDIATIEKVDQNYRDGEYDSDAEGFAKDVRKRLNKVEDMVNKLTKSSLKAIMKELVYTGARGGTNAVIADEIVQTLHYKAENGSSLKKEYRMVKSYFGGCYGGCGEESDSGLGGDSDSNDEEA